MTMPLRCIRWLATWALAGLMPILSAHAAAPATRSETLPDALARARAAVVGIQVTTLDDARTAETLGRERVGSGVVIGPDGLILTIGYLLFEAQTITIETHDRRQLPARVVAFDMASGFGLLRPLVPLRGVQPVPLGTLDGLQPGNALMVVIGGDGGDIGLTRVVDLRPFSGYWEYHIDSALFASPPVVQHSGAPVFNRRGELLGVGSLFMADLRGDGQRLPGNMYVPVDLLKPVLAELQQTGTTRQGRRAWIGVNAAERSGRVWILNVLRDSPAQAAGLNVGDVVLAVDGAEVHTLERFYRKLWERPAPDGEIRLTVQRGEQQRQITLRAVDRLSIMKRPAGI